MDFRVPDVCFHFPWRGEDDFFDRCQVVEGSVQLLSQSAGEDNHAKDAREKLGNAERGVRFNLWVVGSTADALHHQRSAYAFLGGGRGGVWTLQEVFYMGRFSGTQHSMATYPSSYNG